MAELIGGTAGRNAGRRAGRPGRRGSVQSRPAIRLRAKWRSSPRCGVIADSARKGGSLWGAYAAAIRTSRPVQELSDVRVLALITVERHVEQAEPKRGGSHDGQANCGRGARGPPAY
jgi:hypothetical protein